MPRPRPTPRQRAIAAAVIFGLLFAALGAVVALGRVLGAEYGEPCVPRAGFACRNEGFNDARCLADGPDQRSGRCTRLCVADADCPGGHHCNPARWYAGPRDQEGSSEEWVCTAP